MIDKKKIAAVTVLYNPSDEMLRNIQHYRSDVAVVYAVDNSETCPPDREKKLAAFGNVTYIGNGANLGISCALNIAAGKAIEEGFKFLLTMDQDSKVRPGMIQTMLECAAESDLGTIGIVSPAHLYPYSHRGGSDTPCEEVLTAMTSGNLLNLEAYRKTGPFRDDFFIDSVDDEYCLRLRLSGFKVVRANNALLDHPIGAITEHRFFLKKFAISNHPPVRRYYGIRNKLYLRKIYRRQFPEYFHFFHWKIFRETATILLYEKEKLKKISMMIKGCIDYRNGARGEYSAREGS